MNAYLALTVSIIIGVGGQISLKAGAIEHFGNKILFLQPYVLVGLASYFVAALFYIYSLKTIPISLAFPSVSISYVAVALLAHLFLGEPFGGRHFFALLLISLGIYILSRS